MGSYNDLRLTVTCGAGIERATKKELERLGYTDCPAINGAITFEADSLAVSRCNLFLRTADRVYINLKEFTANTFDELFDGVSEIFWEDFLPKNARVVVNGKCVKSQLFAISACQSIVKKAIATRLCKKYRVSKLSEDGVDYEVYFSVYKNVATVLLNTTGVGLHKRGYRDMVGIAPIRETLASALILYSDYYYKKPFADPFCGSGTIPIECANIALNIASGKHRDFAFKHWSGFDKKNFDLAMQEALDKECLDRQVEIFASDIDRKAVGLATRHLERAGLKGRVKFSTLSVEDFSTALKGGTIVTNPPYGIRVYDKEEAEQCYRWLKTAFDKLDGWSLFLITAAKNFERVFGKKADRERKLFNSNTECRYYYYYGKPNKEINDD
ncbi:MAG: class I SAM-dependent RNA methyltransferase [Clostridiales bacterium]|nr:class I SAM-dependent RNA methyltransferase [Clostridiales bacterium]